MEDILRKIDDLSLDELDKLYKHIYSIREIKRYYEGIEEQDNNLPENVGDIIKNKIKIIRVNNDVDAYMSYEEGNSIKIKLNYYFKFIFFLITIIMRPLIIFQAVLTACWIPLLTILVMKKYESSKEVRIARKNLHRQRVQLGLESD